MAFPKVIIRMNQPYASTHAFSDKAVRLAFIRKVYLILMVQLLVTAFIVMLFVLVDEVARYFRTNSYWMSIAALIVIVCLITLVCCEGPRHVTPWNYVLLFIFTVAEGFMLGVISATYEVKEVLIALGLCAFLCFALTLFAFQTKIDFTPLGGILLAGLLVLLVLTILVSIVSVFFLPIKVLNLITASVGAFIFSVFLIYDTQLMIGGNHKYAISPEDYIFAALTLYVDIINLFLYILILVSGGRRTGR